MDKKRVSEQPQTMETQSGLTRKEKLYAVYKRPTLPKRTQVR